MVHSWAKAAFQRNARPTSWHSRFNLARSVRTSGDAVRTREFAPLAQRFITQLFQGADARQRYQRQQRDTIEATKSVRQLVHRGGVARQSHRQQRRQSQQHAAAGDIARDLKLICGMGFLLPQRRLLRNTFRDHSIFIERQDPRGEIRRSVLPPERPLRARVIRVPLLPTSQNPVRNRFECGTSWELGVGVCCR